jgi:hypothetical protein
LKRFLYGIAQFVIDKPVLQPYNDSEEQTTHTVSSSGYRLICGNATKNNRHLSGVAVAFFAFLAFAFLEVSRTIIVTVHFFMWKVKRIRTTPFLWGMEPTACVFVVYSSPSLTGNSILQDNQGIVNPVS